MYEIVIQMKDGKLDKFQSEKRSVLGDGCLLFRLGDGETKSVNKMDIIWITENYVKTGGK